MKKHFIISIVAVLLLIGALWYFGCYSYTIGSPTGATVQYIDYRQAQYKTVELSQEPTTRLAEILKNTRPTVFWQDSCGIGNEDILITLHYPGDKTKVFSLWHMRSVLYEGGAEELSMSAMLGNNLHVGGSVDDELPEFLTPLCPGIETLDSPAN